MLFMCFTLKMKLKLSGQRSNTSLVPLSAKKL
jgi:hypothetical protein